MPHPLFSVFSLAAGLGLAALTGCEPHRLEPYQTERFDLTAGPAAAEGYPMEVVEGRFLTSDGKSFTVAPKLLEGDWGLSHTTYVSGDGTSPAPDSLEVRWFSYTEDKFYEGHWLMPQKRIYDLLKQGFWNTDDKKHETYNELTMCLLPKGVAVVWLTGANKVLLGRYQGQEVNFDFKRFNLMDDRPRSLVIEQAQAELPPAVQAQIRSGTLSTRQWDEYLKTYPWKIAFGQPLKLYNYGAILLNEEMLNYPLSPQRMAPYLDLVLEPSAKAVPRNLYLWVDAGYGRTRQIQVRAFDEAETQAAFQTLHAANPTLPLTLYFDTDERVTKGRLFLKNDRQQVELRKSEILFFATE
jgi:hypothetical protein